MEVMEFLHPDNPAGNSLLTLVARGSAIIAELLRLSDHIPSIFLGSPSNPVEREKYAHILFDFQYLKNQDDFEEKVEKDMDVVDLDEEFRENHMLLLERFYKLFESVYKYIVDLNSYLEEMMEGVFVQHTIEGVLLDNEGRQLMCEALYLYGVMLLLLDLRIPGPTRERMIVSYYRYKGAATIPNIDEVCKMCRRTGYRAGGKRPKNYPEEYFSRFTIEKKVVEMMISRLRSDDIYNNMSAYPNPEHRSTALAAQSGMLYVCLYFIPEILSKKTAIMREIVDKHFSDNWVIAFYLGQKVDLSEWWDPYKAAKKALSNSLHKTNILEITDRHLKMVPKIRQGLDKYLTKGVLVDPYVLTHIRDLLKQVRDCNVTLRWLTLHRTTSHKKYKDLVGKLIDHSSLMTLLMDTAQFEFLLKTTLKRLLDSKHSRWEECKKEASERMSELSDYFSGEKELAKRVKKNTQLQEWFKLLAQEINGLDFQSSVVAGRKIAHLIQALEEVEEFHQVEDSVLVKQFLLDIRDYLGKMIRTVNVSDKVLGDLDLISDFSYAWDIIPDFTPLMHSSIKADPSICLRLRATFLKLQSILSLPLTRITQSGSKDDVSVAAYYSSCLVSYVRTVLDVIPKSVFLILDSIIRLQTHELEDLPTKMERKYLKKFSQLGLRHKLAEKTHQVSVFTEGILAMKSTLLGIIKLDPRQLLEDGIRKELVRQNARAMNEYMTFQTGQVKDFESRLENLGVKLDGIRRSFEYIQDYINLYGLRIWQEEFSRIINYNVEQESNSFLKKKVHDWQSTFQSDAIPIPRFPSAPASKGIETSVNFMGRLVREVRRQTNPKKTVYVESLQGWYDEKGLETVGIRTFSLLNRGVGVFGLTGMDRLICFMIVRDLAAFVRLYRKTINKQMSQFVTSLSRELQPTSQFPPNPQKLYVYAQQRTQKIWSNFREYIVKIGQAQLIRRQIAHELNFTCQMDSKILYCTLEVLNRALINEVQAHYARPDQKPGPENPLLPDFTKFLETSGINDAITKIYITTEPLEGLPCLMFLFVLSQVSKLQWNRKLNTLECLQKNVNLDGAPFVVGVITLLKQFHSSHTHTFLGYLGQYARSSIHTSKQESDIPAPVRGVLLFLEEFCKFSSLSRKAINAIVPSYIFDRFTH